MLGAAKPVPFKVNVQNASDGIFTNYVHSQQQKKRSDNIQEKQCLRFPVTRAVLWNRSQIGETVNISYAEIRKIKMYICDKTLLLASKHGQPQSNSMHGFLIGDFITGDGELILQVDRFDPGRNIQIQTETGAVARKVPTAIIPGDHAISLAFCQNIFKGVADLDTSSREFVQSVEVLHNRCRTKGVVNVPDMFMSRASFNYQADVNELIIRFKCNVVTFSTGFLATPINPVPIIPTALAKNLSGPMRLSHIQGSAKFGYLTMDQTRKLLVLLETDPKVESLPLVGIWVSGLTSLCHAYVWACCLKFINADYIKERVLAPPSSFLLVHYPTTKAYPDFYECCVESEDGKTPFTLLTCQEQYIVSLKPDSSDAVSMDLCVADEANLQLFNDAVQQWTDKTSGHGLKRFSQQLTQPIGSNKSNDEQTNKDDDSMPTPSRQLPRPHARSNELHPSVPDPSFVETRLIGSATTKGYNPRMYQESERSTAEEDPSKESFGIDAAMDDAFSMHHGTTNQVSHRHEKGREREATGLGRRGSGGFEKTTGSSSLRRVMLEDATGQNGVMDANTTTPISSFQVETEARKSVDGKRTSFGGNEARLNEADEPDVTLENMHGMAEDRREESVRTDTRSVLPVEQQDDSVLLNNEKKRIQRTTLNGSDPLSLIAAHEQQLFELQEQIEILLEQKREEDLRNLEVKKRQEMKSTSNTSVQCSFAERKPETASISVNTGESLLLLESPQERSVTRNNEQRCRCSCRCESFKKTQRRQNFSQHGSDSMSKKSLADPSHESVSHIGSTSLSNQSCSLSDLRAVDISARAGPGNTTAMSMQSFASVLEAVDVPVFDDSQNAEPESPNDIELGESASMIASKTQNEPADSMMLDNEEGHSQREADEQDTTDVTEKEFYQQMVDEVKGFLSDQFDNIEDESNHEEDTREEETHSPNISTGSFQAESMTEIDRQKQVEDATLHQLRVLGVNIGHDNKDDAIRDITPTTRDNQLAPMTPGHPRINYVSMLSDDTDDASEVADAIAMKYLTSKQLKEVACSVQQHKTKTVTFEGVVQQGISTTPKSQGFNYVSMNFSCNMSIATKRYMQRYNLLDTTDSGDRIHRKDKRVIARKAREKENTPINSSNILDLNKLKQLPKLL